MGPQVGDYVYRGADTAYSGVIVKVKPVDWHPDYTHSVQINLSEGKGLIFLMNANTDWYDPMNSWVVIAPYWKGRWGINIFNTDIYMRDPENHNK